MGGDGGGGGGGGSNIFGQNKFGQSSMPSQNNSSNIFGNSNNFSSNTFGQPGGSFMKPAASGSFGQPSSFGAMNNNSNTMGFNSAPNTFGSNPLQPGQPIQQAQTMQPLQQPQNQFQQNPQNPSFGGLTPNPASSNNNVANQTSTNFGAPAQATQAPQQNNAQSEEKQDPIYSKISDLNPEELKEFQASEFNFNNMPLKPPPKELCQPIQIKNKPAFSLFS